MPNALRLIPILLAGLLTASTAKADDSYRLMFAALPEKPESTPENPLTPEKIALGKKLFFETRMSQDNGISCNSCHNLMTFGVDNKPVSPGHRGTLGTRNSPTVFNSALHFTQFWDGRAATVEEQALGPIMNPKEMAMGAQTDVLGRLKELPEYPELFKKAFPGESDPLTFTNIGKSIGAFERTLLTPSRFDDYLRGDNAALKTDERAGLKLFVETGCVACHSGRAIGGSMYQKLGVVVPYETKDLGRYEVTKSDSDKFMFKVPSLRNVAKTGPYFHDGSVATLNDAVKLMAKHQLGRDLSGEQIESIVKFLNTLTSKDTPKY